MSFIGDIIGEITGANKAGKAAEKAAGQQVAFGDKAIAETRAAREEARADLSPYNKAGGAALTQLLASMGLGPEGSEAAFVNGVKSSPIYGAQIQAGEDAILANASATGGLRGGNVNDALSRLRAQALATEVQRVQGNLQGVTSLGQNAAAMTGNNGMNSAAAISNLLQQQGAALAGGTLAKGNTNRMAFNDALAIAGTVVGF